ncbi:MAG: hypothetical protein R2726_08530 [Acidimicrobiales bacterium]
MTDQPTPVLERGEARLYIVGSAFQALAFGLLVVVVVSMFSSGAWVIPALFGALISVFIGNVFIVQVRLKLRERGALPDEGEVTPEQRTLARKLLVPFSLMTDARMANRRA